MQRQTEYDIAPLATCPQCGRRFDQEVYGPDNPVNIMMERSGLCHTCQYWNDMCRGLPDNAIIHKGAVYIARPCDPGDFKGYQRLRHFFLTDTLSLMVACDGYRLAKVPERYSDRLKDNAVLISPRTYRWLKKRIHNRCQMKGCWDRRTCLWYGGETMNWNVIPDNHEEGGEGCRNYINRQILISDECSIYSGFHGRDSLFSHNPVVCSLLEEGAKENPGIFAEDK